MIDFEYAHNVGCRSPEGQRIDNCWDNPAVLPTITGKVAELAEYTSAVAGFTGFQADLESAKSSAALDNLERLWFGALITKGSYPRRMAAYKWATR